MMTFIESIFLLLLVALILGELFERFNFPAIVGELLTGLILGPAVLGLVSMNPVFQGLSEIALFFLVLLIGIEVTTETLVKYYKEGILFTFSSFIAPLIVMILVSQFVLGMGEPEALIVSMTVAVPSISIVSVLLRNFSLLKLESGHVFLASVIITDIIAFGVLSAIISPDKIYVDVPGLLALLFLIFIADYFIRKNSNLVVKMFERLHARERGEKVIFGAIIVSGLVVSSILEMIGITFVLGAFFAGIMISELVVGSELHNMLVSTLNRLNDSFFIPIFFSIAGVEMVLPQASAFVKLAVLLAIAAGVGGPLNYYFSKWHIKDALPRTTVGVLGSRGSVGIIIATIAFNAGYIGNSPYSIVIFATLILTLAFTPMVRKKDIVLPKKSAT